MCILIVTNKQMTDITYFKHPSNRCSTHLPPPPGANSARFLLFFLLFRQCLSQCSRFRATSTRSRNKRRRRAARRNVSNNAIFPLDSLIPESDVIFLFGFRSLRVYVCSGQQRRAVFR